jgi:hypothetical protein
MSFDLNPLSLIEKFIVEHGSAAVMKVHIDCLRDQLAGLDREATGLKAENAQLKAANKDLAAQLQQRAAQIHALQPTGFVENMGVLWKRTETGFESVPYCKECKSHPIMTPIRGVRMLVCGTGEHHAPFGVKPPSA